MAKKTGNPADVSRRDFLRTTTAGALTTGVLGSTRPAGASPPQSTPVLGPGPVPVRLEINGASHELALEPRVTLLDALRNHLDLTGTKKVCDRGSCGACTVLLDGKAVYSCSLLALEAQGHEIRTIESLGSPEQLSRLQAAFVEHDAQQCGFCTPGFVMAATALLEKTATPGEEAMLRELGGNVCRCGTYVGIRKAIREMAREGGRHA